MTALPKIALLVLKPRAEAFDDPDWLFELKYDGFRALLEIDGAGARLVSRNRNRFRHLDPRGFVLDVAGFDNPTECDSSFVRSTYKLPRSGA